MTKLSRRTLLVGAAGLAAASGAARAAKSKTTARFDLDRFVEDVRLALPEGQAAVEDVLARAVSEPGAVAAALGEPTEVGPQEIYRSPDLTILKVLWAPLMVLPVHNHNMWATIGIYSGREDNILWARTGDVVEASGAASLSEREVYSLPTDAIHSVSNPLQRIAGAIHIYGGDFYAAPRSMWDPETLHEKPHDLEYMRQIFRDANERFQASRG